MQDEQFIRLNQVIQVFHAEIIAAADKANALKEQLHRYYRQQKQIGQNEPKALTVLKTISQQKDVIDLFKKYYVTPQDDASPKKVTYVPYYFNGQRLHSRFHFNADEVENIEDYQYFETNIPNQGAGAFFKGTNSNEKVWGSRFRIAGQKVTSAIEYDNDTDKFDHLDPNMVTYYNLPLHQYDDPERIHQIYRPESFPIIIFDHEGTSVKTKTRRLQATNFTSYLKIGVPGRYLITSRLRLKLYPKSIDYKELRRYESRELYSASYYHAPGRWKQHVHKLFNRKLKRHEVVTDDALRARTVEAHQPAFRLRVLHLSKGKEQRYQLKAVYKSPTKIYPLAGMNVRDKCFHLGFNEIIDVLADDIFIFSIERSPQAWYTHVPYVLKARNEVQPTIDSLCIFKEFCKDTLLPQRDKWNAIELTRLGDLI